MREPEGILVIRRDNIGDLVCTTPLLAALRTHFAKARIEVLANSYNAPVLEGNPDIDRVHMYSKLKHVHGSSGTISALGARISMLWKLRRRGIDLAIVAAGDQDKRAIDLATLLGARCVVCSERSVPGQHEVERTFTAARRLGIQGSIPPLRVVPDADYSHRVRQAISRVAADANATVVGLHISARRAMQRWPAERFAVLARTLQERFNATILLFWSPGAESHPQHPGDDEKAKTIQRLAAGRGRMVPWPTAGLHELIGGLAQCDVVVCSDGGAMHIAAALGKPIACFFGDSDVARWRPWGTRHVVLTAPSRSVADIGVADASAAASVLIEP